jgi:hypothetical protein
MHPEHTLHKIDAQSQPATPEHTLHKIDAQSQPATPWTNSTQDRCTKPASHPWTYSTQDRCTKPASHPWTYCKLDRCSQSPLKICIIQYIMQYRTRTAVYSMDRCTMHNAQCTMYQLVSYRHLLLKIFLIFNVNYFKLSKKGKYCNWDYMKYPT